MAEFIDPSEFWVSERGLSTTSDEAMKNWGAPKRGASVWSSNAGCSRYFNSASDGHEQRQTALRAPSNTARTTTQSAQTQIAARNSK